VEPEPAEHSRSAGRAGLLNLMHQAGANCERKMRDPNETNEMLHGEHSGRRVRLPDHAFQNECGPQVSA
jgi:hypothetical protein